MSVFSRSKLCIALSSLVWCFGIAIPVFSQNPTPPNLGLAGSFGLLSGASISSTTDIYVLGASGAVSTISSTIIADSSKFANNSNPVPAALSALTAARTYCNSLPASSISSTLNGQTLNQGVFTVAGNATLSSISPLTLTGDTNSVFIINISGTLTIQTGGMVILDAVLPENVFWNVTGTITINANAGLDGIVLNQSGISKQGIQLGATSLLSLSAISLSGLDPTIGHNAFISQNYLNSYPNNRFTQQDLNCQDLPLCPLDVVRNGGFETRLNLTPGLSNMGFNPAGRSACSWKDGHRGTSDHFHSDYNSFLSSATGVPNNSLSGFNPATGIGSLQDGILTGSGYAGFNAGGLTTDYREYVMHRIGTMEANRWYFGEFHVSHALRSNFAVTELAMWISNNHPNPTPAIANDFAILDTQDGPGGAAIVPDITNNGASLDNTGNWTRISAPYFANGTEQFITIGNFQDASSVVTSAVAQPQGNTNYAYYFVDDVSLALLPHAGPEQVTLCDGLSVVLGNGNTCGLPPSASLVWTDQYNNFISNDPTITVSPSATTTYTLSIVGPDFTGVNVFSTATVTVNHPKVTVHSQCNVNGTTIFTAQGGSSYTWTGPGINTGPGATPVTGSTFTTLPGFSQGTFTVTDGGCLATASTDPCCNRAYQATPIINNPPAPFFYSQPVIGNPNTLTVIDGNNYGQDVYFSGDYHIIGPIQLINGKFTLAPGTQFFMDGEVEWSAPVCQNFASHAANFNLNYIQVDNRAELIINEATITASCDHMWEGIRLTNGGIIRTFHDAEISDAVCGIKSYNSTACNR